MSAKKKKIDSMKEANEQIIEEKKKLEKMKTEVEKQNKNGLPTEIFTKEPNVF